MDHLCQQCGAEVERGVPFCPKCNAPQIRVSASEQAEPRETRLQGLGSPPPPERLLAAVEQRGGERIDWHFARSRSSIAAAVMVLLMLFPQLSRLFILWMPLSGALAVYLYTRGRPARPLSAGAGARMGATAGLMAFAVLVVLMAAGFAMEHYVLHHSDELVAQMRGQVQQAINSTSDPQVRQLASALLSPNGLALILVLSVIFLFAMFLLLCGIGGAIGAALFGRSSKS